MERERDPKRADEGEVMVGIERLPNKAIEKVVVNPVAKRLLDPNIRHMASEDYIAKNTFLTVPIKKAEAIIPVANDHGRTIPVENGGYPYRHIVGSVILGKGGWLSGSFYHTLPRSPLTNIWGLETKWDADGDLKVNEILLENGFQAALTLGYAVINKTFFESRLKTAWPAHRAFIGSTFRSLAAENSKPVFSLRVGGTPHRILGIGNEYHNQAFPSRLVKGAEIIRLMILRDGHQTKDLIELSGQNKFSIIRSLELLEQKRPLDAEGLRYYSRFFKAVAAKNISILRKIGKDENRKFYVDSAFLGDSKDLDMAFIQYDFDASYDYDYPSRHSLQMQIGKYTEEISRSFVKLTLQMKQSGLLTHGAERFSAQYLRSESIQEQISKMVRKIS